MNRTHIAPQTEFSEQEFLLENESYQVRHCKSVNTHTEIQTLTQTL